MGVVETVSVLISENFRRRVEYLRLGKESSERFTAFVTYEFERGFEAIVIQMISQEICSQMPFGQLRIGKHRWSKGGANEFLQDWSGRAMVSSYRYATFIRWIEKETFSIAVDMVILSTKVLHVLQNENFLLGIRSIRFRIIFRMVTLYNRPTQQEENLQIDRLP